MKDLSADILERIRDLQIDLQRIEVEREKLKEQEQVTEHRLQALYVVLELEHDRVGNAVPMESVISTNGKSRWVGVGISDAVKTLMHENPDWWQLDGTERVGQIYRQLLQEQFEFS